MSTTPKLVVIESPYAPGSGTPELREANLKRYIDYAILCMRDSLVRGECPFASHLLYTHKGLLNDDVPTEREQGIAAGVAWGRHADLTAVYIDFGISGGMRHGIDAALAAGRSIDYRSVGVVQPALAKIRGMPYVMR